MVVITPQTQSILRSNGVIAFPTSTLPGLAALPTSQGLDALFALKHRRADQPVSLGVASLEQAGEFVHVPQFVHELLNAFEIGTLTLILDATEVFDSRLGGSRVAVRVFAHPAAKALAQTVGPVTATSANRSGEIPKKDSEQAGRELGLSGDAIVNGECPGGKGSTLVSVEKSTDSSSGYSVSIMREGVVPQSDVTAWMLKNH
jgi:L-threonylcarbamoyladenylate synthase